jgi:two-component system OmpR family sensor kinase
MTTPQKKWVCCALFTGTLLLLAAIILALLMQGNLSSNLLLREAVILDLGIVLIVCCLLLSSMIWATSLLSWYWLRRGAQALAQESHRHAEKYRHFIRRLDHELKTPIAVLQVALATAVEPIDPSGLAVYSTIARLHGLIRGLRKLSDLETCSMEQEPVNLVKLLQEIILAMHSIPEREERSISLIVPQPSCPLASVNGDRDILMLAFYNLLDNACKFTSPCDTIEVRIHLYGAAVTVEVADSGQGISESDLPHLFEELYRGSNASNVGGNGLGLAIVKRSIERHSGRVTVNSWIGQGTVFTVRLPLL